MQNRTIDEVSTEFKLEGHLPMYRLIESLKREQWSSQLVFDTSVLRLWAARKTIPEVEIMITYGDGRNGGRPINMDLDSFDLALLKMDGFETSLGINAKIVFEKIRLWFETHDSVN
jgi:hypothetical protein